jgi:Uncharacterized protein conserved in bacteria (DUF2188)
MSIKKKHMSNKKIFIERRDDQQDYAIRRPNSERASDVLPTQREAIERAREIDPKASILVERVRHTDNGTPDHWRKP